ncbi:MAG: MoxR family ATPase [Clostridiales bacterium]|nr:MoxR family ATPase [Clostridiales bacterium]
MSEKTNAIISEVKKVICGKDYVILQALAGILSGGHVLIEDVPGVGKTTMALAFSRTLGLDYGRMQFTPDVLPSDITGFSVFDKQSQTMKYQPGSIFHNLFLADELNRASSRTQSALLEAMEEGQVTVDGNTYPLPKPFTVFATQNPSGASGTSLLPDSQMDRFVIRISMGYPSNSDEKAMLEQRKNGQNPMNAVCCLSSAQELNIMQAEVSRVFVSEPLLDYIIALVAKTRVHKDLERGASPRATLALASMSRAYAYLFHRDYVIPADVQAVFPAVMCHRLLLTPEAEVNEKRASDVVREIVKSVPAPKI